MSDKQVTEIIVFIWLLLMMGFALVHHDWVLELLRSFSHWALR